MKRWILLMLACLGIAHGQTTSFYTDRAVGSFPTSEGVAVLVPIPYGQVRVCTVGATGSPCTPLASIFDTAGSPISNSIGGNFGQVTTDVVGRFTFGCTPGSYLVQVAATGSNTPQLNYKITCGINTSLSNPFPGPFAINGAITATSVDGMRKVGPGIGEFTHIQDCLNDIPNVVYTACGTGHTCRTSGGGWCEVVPGYVDTPTGNITFTEDKKLLMHSPSGIVLGASNQVIIPGGANGAGIICDANNRAHTDSGCWINATGGQKEVVVGDPTLATQTTDVFLVNLQIHCNNCSAAGQPLEINNSYGGHYWWLDLLVSDTAPSAASMITNSNQGNYNEFKGIFAGNVQFNGEQGSTWELGGVGQASSFSTSGFTLNNTVGLKFNNTQAYAAASGGSGPMTHYFNLTGTTQNTDITTDEGGVFVSGTTVVFGASTTNNTVKCTSRKCSVTDSSGAGSGNSVDNLFGPVLDTQGTAAALTGDGTDKTMFTYTLPANALMPKECLDIEYVFFKATDTVSTEYKVIIGSTTLADTSSTSTDNTQAEGTIVTICNNVGSQTAQKWWSKDYFRTAAVANVDINRNRLSNSGATAAIDFTVSNVIKGTFKVANPNQVTPEHWTVRHYRGQ